jgi:glyoxylase-like metal-dependent hydrolase (beta-lactamase superfamily II)
MEAGMAKPRASEVVSDVYVVVIGRGTLSTNVYLIRDGSSWTLVDAGCSGREKKIRAAPESVFGPGARPESMAKIAAGPDLTAVVQPFDPRARVPGMPGWAAIHTPGHTQGDLSLYRRSERVLISGDAVITVDLNSLIGVPTTRSVRTSALQQLGLGRGTTVHRRPGGP